jgi:hypothetical protein
VPAAPTKELQSETLTTDVGESKHDKVQTESRTTIDASAAAPAAGAYVALGESKHYEVRTDADETKYPSWLAVAVQGYEPARCAEQAARRAELTELTHLQARRLDREQGERDAIKSAATGDASSAVSVSNGVVPADAGGKSKSDHAAEKTTPGATPTLLRMGRCVCVFLLSCCYAQSENTAAHIMTCHPGKHRSSPTHLTHQTSFQHSSVHNSADPQ